MTGVGADPAPLIVGHPDARPADTRPSDGGTALTRATPQAVSRQLATHIQALNLLEAQEEPTVRLLPQANPDEVRALAAACKSAEQSNWRVKAALAHQMRAWLTQAARERVGDDPRTVARLVKEQTRLVASDYGASASTITRRAAIHERFFQQGPGGLSAPEQARVAACEPVLQAEEYYRLALTMPDPIGTLELLAAQADADPYYSVSKARLAVTRLKLADAPAHYGDKIRTQLLAMPVVYAPYRGDYEGAISTRLDDLTTPDATVYVECQAVHLQQSFAVLVDLGLVYAGILEVPVPRETHGVYCRQNHRFVLVGQRGAGCPPREAPSSVVPGGEQAGAVPRFLVEVYPDVARLAVWVTAADAAVLGRDWYYQHRLPVA